MKKSAILLIGMLAAPAGAAEYLPVYNFTLLGGQYFFTGDKTNLNANSDLTIAPGMKFNDQWTLLPIYSNHFRGTKSVLDSVGASSLFQQQMDHRVSATGIYSVPESTWKLKPTMSYGRSFLKETKDERWGHGLFDYQTTGLGVSAENTYKAPFSFRMGYDFFWIKFNNFKSLESQSGLDPSGNPLGRETAGTRTLDTFNHALSFNMTRPYPYNSPKVSLSADYRFTWTTFPDQPIITKTGSPYASRNMRQDFNQALSLSVGYPRPIKGSLRMGSALTGSYSYTGSNQNTFDAGQSKYIPDAYSFMSWSIGPQVNFSWGDEKDPVSAGMSFSFTRTRYLGRMSQLRDGTYLDDDKQRSNSYLMTLHYGYPIAENFRLTAQTNFLWARSNNNYESTYRYNYTTSNYLMGFSYSY